MVTRQRVNFTLDTMYSKGVKNYLWKLREFTNMLDDQETRKIINYFIGSEINRFVPKKSGQLRSSMKVYPDKITWGEGLPYAQYQFGGQVYGPNIPGAINGEPAWKSPSKKYPTGREIGSFKGVIPLKPLWQKGNKTVKGFLPYKFGYTTPKTQHHWTDVYQGKLKSDTNKRITKYLKDECKMRGLNV